MKNLSPGTVIAAIALFIVIGGTATAASGLINGKNIKPGTVTAKQIKNKSITRAKLAPATVRSLRGARGPQGQPGAPGPAGGNGATGATGPTGSTGATGADGIVQPLHAAMTNLTLPGGEQTIPLTLNVDPGVYMLTAKANVWSNSGQNYIDCTIWTDETHGVDTAVVESDTTDSMNLAMMAVSEVEAKVELRCMALDGAGAANHLKLIAVPVQG